MLKMRMLEGKGGSVVAGTRAGDAGGEGFAAGRDVGWDCDWQVGGVGRRRGIRWALRRRGNSCPALLC
jgi:hypothetical protein